MGRNTCCPRCGIDGFLQKRTFSDQALAALVSWEELEASLVDEAVCHECYVELRDVLIERSEELGDLSHKKIEKVRDVG